MKGVPARQFVAPAMGRPEAVLQNSNIHQARLHLTHRHYPRPRPVAPSSPAQPHRHLTAGTNLGPPFQAPKAHRQDGISGNVSSTLPPRLRRSAQSFFGHAGQKLYIRRSTRAVGIGSRVCAEEVSTTACRICLFFWRLRGVSGPCLSRKLCSARGLLPERAREKPLRQNKGRVCRRPCPRQCLISHRSVPRTPVPS
jgi:hypothetical protein